jgi:glyoxylase-like metal-dependent hydrolase (beta-lactamase superfamily II)
LLTPSEVKPLHLADVTLPAGTPQAGEVCPVYGFVVTHPAGAVVVDTGIGEGHPGVESLYRPARRPLAEHLSALKIAPADVVLVINTHLHFDHCGDNRLFPGTPVVVQRAEYEAAQESAYTVPGWVNFPRARFHLLDGEAEVLPGLTAVPTPGHTPGHQSVMLETGDGPVIIAGQAAYTAEEFSNPARRHARGLEMAWDLERSLESLRRLQALGPQRVYFSHDPAIWEA